MALWMRCMVWLAVAGCATRSAPVEDPTPEASLVDLDARRPGDEREQRVITLENGLDVLLISDPDLQQSAAALAVEVGSLEDPWEHLGMAHFLEHMLFLGTEKYPDEAEYGAYLRGNGGYSNAYTSSDHTNYLFEVNHDALEGALDRFAQFFIAPLFTAEFVEREMNAVNSEHAKNLQNDFWRMRMVTRALHREGHPRQKFSTGTLDTLKNVTREELIAFYDRYYSANLMHLVIMSTEGLDQLETWARDKFSPIENRNAEAPTYPSDIFPDDLPQRIQIEPVGDRRDLRLEFSVPPTTQMFATKPGQLLGSLIGHEGEGSLLSQLKGEGLVTSLSAGVQNERYRGIFGISMELTEKGLENPERVIELVFGYVAMLREEGLPASYFREQQIVGDLDFYFREHQTGGNGAAFLTGMMMEHPAEVIERRLYTLERYDPEAFASYVAELRPGNMRTVLVAKGVETDAVEPNYGTRYKKDTWPTEVVASWAGAAPTEAMHFPLENTFLPSDVSLLMNDPNEGPYQLISGDQGVVWFEQDRKFQLPRDRVSLLLLSGDVNASPRHRLIAELYVRSIREGLNEWAYLVREAGLAANISSERRGIRLQVSGYAQRIPQLLDETAGKLETITIGEDTFADLRDDLAREYANNDYELALRQGLYEMNLILDPNGIHRDAYRDLVGEITLDEVKAFAASVYDEVAFEGVAYGNLDGAALKASIEQAVGTLAEGTLAAEARPPEPTTVKLPAKAHDALVKPNKTDNHAWAQWVQVGERSPRHEAMVRLAYTHLGSPFYSELRTRQQLGYIVGGYPSTSRSGTALVFYLQSGEYPATTLAERAHAFLAEAVPAMRELSDEDYGKLQQAVVAVVKQEEADMNERMGTLEDQGLRLGGAFDWNDRVAAEVEAMSKDDLVDALEAAMNPKTGSRLAIYLDADGAEASKPKKVNVIDDVDAYRKALPTF